MNNFFEKIYLINLPTRRDRLKLMQLTLPFEFVIVEGIYDEIGSRGLTKTYRKLLSDAVNYNRVLIIEDDVSILKSFELLPEYFDYDVIYLGANQFRFHPTQETDNGFYHVYPHKLYYTYGTYAISFNKTVSRGLKQYLDNFTPSQPIDIIINEFIKFGGYSSIIPFPFIFMPDVSDSNTQAPRSQEQFCVERRYNINNYNYLSLSSIHQVKRGLGSYSLRRCDPSLLEPVYSFFKGDYKKIFYLLEDKKSFVFIVPSFNNERWINLNLLSIFIQDYDPYLFRVIYINDCSTDRTFDLLNEFIESHGVADRITVLNSNTKQGQQKSRYDAYHMCDDDEIVIFLDGDDWLYDHEVLLKLNGAYQNNILLTYGSYYCYEEGEPEMGVAYSNLYGTRSFPQSVVDNKTYREYDWLASHLRTGYAKLFKNIDISDLTDENNKMYVICTDYAEMCPALEMAGDRHMCMREPLCVYNKLNSKLHSTSYYNNDMREERNRILKRIRNSKKYEKIDFC